MDDLRELSRRLERLERRERTYKQLLMLVAAVALATVLMAQVRPPVRPEPVRFPEATHPVSQTADGRVEGKIRAEAFVLTDSRGQERASLVTDGGGSVF